MPQIQLPMFPAGVTHITAELAFECRDGTVTYFNGVMPVMRHASNDVATFRMITSQFVVNGNARNADIIRAFGVPAVTVKRAVKRYRESGAKVQGIRGRWYFWYFSHPGERRADAAAQLVMSCDCTACHIVDMVGACGYRHARMPRGPRLDAPGCLHYVIARGIERRPLFADDADREDLVARLAGLAERTGAVVLAWALLPNHALCAAAHKT